MSRIVKPLGEMGVTVEATDGEFPPLTIHGGHVRPIRYEMPVASAQVKSCVLFAGLYANGVTEVLEREVTRDHSERMLNSFGARLEMKNRYIGIEGGHTLQGHRIFVPGDLSSAAFFIAAAAMLPDSELIIRGVGVNPTRRALLSVLSEMGADIRIRNEVTLNEEDIADLIVRGSQLRSIRLEGEIIAQLIDEIPILAVLATQAEGQTIIRDAGELRHKESDRLRTISQNLQALGAKVEEFEDGLGIGGPVRLKGGDVDSHTDHRIAMAFAIAGLVTEDEVRIHNAEAAGVSFPNFYEILDEVTVH
jgi:3-phosphoshikimate 1-carboxyvinyltransferase